VIDAHVHIWTLDPARYPWQQTLGSVPIPQAAAPAEDLLGQMDAAGVDKALLVQPSIYGWDNSYLCDSADRYPDRFAAVCLVDPRSPRAGDDLRYWCRERGCCGVRINVIEEQSADWLTAQEQRGLWEAALELGVSVSLQIRPDHAAAVARLARDYPRIRFVVDYMGASAAHDGTGVTALGVLGEEPNISCKLLAIGQDSREQYPFGDLWPLYKAAVDSFGARRLIFGTDFPHVMTASSYVQATQLVSVLPFVSEQDRELICDVTASEIWRFDRS